ncbi:hypothetical protein DL764_005204 [Monosporascus ibericus]|uniref:Uncharacterized protein n=1 Tax=Monosporascus ibericus TaxID=155417 RepID=A0A4V1XAN3_9PEZI|nr:hypothetical protein DL764_005204 [Monosporascus ibericus]
MFETQWLEPARKRSREEDEYEGIITCGGSGMGFTEHRNVSPPASPSHPSPMLRGWSSSASADDDRQYKQLNHMLNNVQLIRPRKQKRLQSLPFRTSPTQKRWTDPPSLPAPHPPPNGLTSSGAESQKWSSAPDLSQQHSPNPPMDVDRDADMVADDSYAPQNLASAPSRPDPSMSGRIPTPIHCTFAAQVRGNSWAPMNQSAHAANQVVNVASENHGGFTSRRNDSVPRSLGGAAEWSMVQDRRLPSPISECGGEDTPSTPGMVLDSSCSPVMANLQRPYLPHLPHSTNPVAMLLHPNIQTTPPQVADVVDADAGMTDADAANPTSAPASPSPRGKFGHCRSKHTLNSWTLQPGMKKSFSIGYRADCEKCRMKIPGHFNHIIVS